VLHLERLLDFRIASHIDEGAFLSSWSDASDDDDDEPSPAGRVVDLLPRSIDLVGKECGKLSSAVHIDGTARQQQEPSSTTPCPAADCSDPMSPSSTYHGYSATTAIITLSVELLVFQV
jgi:hypothetical protein